LPSGGMSEGGLDYVIMGLRFQLIKLEDGQQCRVNKTVNNQNKNKNEQRTKQHNNR